MLADTCNIARNFISTNLTFPHTRHFHDYSISTVFRYRPVHSDFSSADITLHTRHRYFIDSRPITPSHLWLGFALPIRAVAGAYSRLQRAVSVSENAFRFFQRSIRGSVSRRYPIIPLLGVSVREFSSPSFLPLCRRTHAEFICDNVSLHYQMVQVWHHRKSKSTSRFCRRQACTCDIALLQSVPDFLLPVLQTIHPLHF